MNYFVAKPDYAHGCATEIIRYVPCYSISLKHKINLMYCVIYGENKVGHQVFPTKPFRDVDLALLTCTMNMHEYSTLLVYVISE